MRRNRWGGASGRRVGAATVTMIAGLAWATPGHYGDWDGKANYHVGIRWMLDFDQQRSSGAFPRTGGSVSGLPRGGGSYCAPAAWANVLTYYAGFGERVVPGTTRETSINWRNRTSESVYETTTDVIGTLGVLMGTDPVSGTNRIRAHYAIRDLLRRTRLTVDSRFVRGGYGPQMRHLAKAIANGGVATVGYGRYQRRVTSGTVWYQRTGGHRITPTLVRDRGASQWMLWRDPNRPVSGRTSQSPFSDVSAPWRPFGPVRSSPSGRRRGYVELVLGGTGVERLMDSISVVQPRRVLGIFRGAGPAPAGGPGALMAPTGLLTIGTEGDVPWLPVATGVQHPFEQLMGTVIDAEFHPNLADYAAVVELAPGGPRVCVLGEVASQIEAADAPAPEVRDPAGLLVLPAMPNVDTIVFGRDLRLYAAGGPEVMLLDTAGGLDEAPEDGYVAATFIAPGPVIDIAYHDASDRVVLLLDLPGAFALATINAELDPSSLVIQSLAHLDVRPEPNSQISVGEATVYVTTPAGSVLAYDIGAITGDQIPGGLLASARYENAAQGPITSIDLDDDGDLLLVSGGVLSDLEVTPGGLIPDAGSGLHGRELGEIVRITRARETGEAGVHDVEPWLDIVEDDFPPVPQPQFNEIRVSEYDPADEEDFIELAALPDADLGNIGVIVIEGEAGSAGVVNRIDHIAPGRTAGPDGLYVIGLPRVAERDQGQSPFEVGRFLPLGTSTFVLVADADEASLQALVGTDIDADDDGVADIPLAQRFVVLDEVSIKARADGVTYAPEPIGPSFVSTFGTPVERAPAGILREGDAPGPWSDTFLNRDVAVTLGTPDTPAAPNATPAGEAGVYNGLLATTIGDARFEDFNALQISNGSEDPSGVRLLTGEAELANLTLAWPGPSTAPEGSTLAVLARDRADALIDGPGVGFRMTATQGAWVVAPEFAGLGQVSDVRVELRLDDEIVAELINPEDLRIPVLWYTEPCPIILGPCVVVDTGHLSFFRSEQPIDFVVNGQTLRANELRYIVGQYEIAPSAIRAVDVLATGVNVQIRRQTAVGALGVNISAIERPTITPTADGLELTNIGTIAKPEGITVRPRDAVGRDDNIDGAGIRVRTRPFRACPLPDDQIRFTPLAPVNLGGDGPQRPLPDISLRSNGLGGFELRSADWFSLGSTGSVILRSLFEGELVEEVTVPSTTGAPTLASIDNSVKSVGGELTGITFNAALHAGEAASYTITFAAPARIALAGGVPLPADTLVVSDPADAGVTGPVGSFSLVADSAANSPTEEGFGPMVITGIDFQPAPVGCSPADLAEAFGTLDIFDILGFFELFGAGDPAADVNGDEVLDVFDILRFFEIFGQGC